MLSENLAKFHKTNTRSFPDHGAEYWKIKNKEKSLVFFHAYHCEVRYNDGNS